MKFESDVRKELVVGFDEVKASLANVTVSEIINQIPEKFKKDLENETAQASEHAIQSLIKRLKESETIEKELFNNKELERIVREVAERAIGNAINEMSSDYPESHIRHVLTQAISEVMRQVFDFSHYDYPSNRFPPSGYDKPPFIFLPMHRNFMNELTDEIVYKLKRK